MTTVLLGSNRFVDCETLIAIRDSALLRVTVGPLRVSLTTPRNVPPLQTVEVTDNHTRGNAAEIANIQVVATDKGVAVFWHQRSLVIATLLEIDTVSLKMDLRPIGVNLYDDAGTLHIGGNAFTGNLFQSCKVGIRLG